MAGLTFSIQHSIGKPAARINLATALTFRFMPTPGTENIAQPPRLFTRETRFLGLAFGYLRSPNHLFGELESRAEIYAAAHFRSPFRHLRCCRFILGNAVWP